MQVAVLASGSRGNATFIELDGKKLLIDAGISARRIRQELEGIGQSIEELDGVFITHEHGDHISGLVTLTKKYGVQVYSRPETFRAMSCYSELPIECINPIIDRVRLDRVTVRAFDIPHDAANPVGYVVQGSSRCVVATDMGFVDSSLQELLEGARVMVLETNHDVEMLKNGSYPYSLKKRILGARGHLSNRDAALAVAGLKRRPKKLLLAHLSESNNRPELARETVQEVFSQQGIHDVELYLTGQNKCTCIQL